MSTSVSKLAWQRARLAFYRAVQISTIWQIDLPNHRDPRNRVLSSRSYPRTNTSTTNKPCKSAAIPHLCRGVMGYRLSCRREEITKFWNWNPRFAPSGMEGVKVRGTWWVQPGCFGNVGVVGRERFHIGKWVPSTCQSNIEREAGLELGLEILGKGCTRAKWWDVSRESLLRNACAVRLSLV